jgi:hypothetical protein
LDVDAVAELRPVLLISLPSDLPLPPNALNELLDSSYGALLDPPGA